MANTNAPFTPATAASLAITATAQTVTLPTNGDVIMVQNAGTAVSFFSVGATVATASTSSFPVLGNTVQLYTIDPSATVLSGIGTTGNTLYITRGYGNR